MKHRHILTFFVAFLFMTIVPDSDAALVKRPEKGRAPFPKYVKFAQNRNQFPCNARLRFKGLCFVEQTDPWGAASVVRIPFNSPNGKGRLNAYGVVVHAIMVGDVVVGGSYSTGKNVTWNFDTFYREGKRRGKVTFYVDGKYWHYRDYPLE